MVAEIRFLQICNLYEIELLYAMDSELQQNDNQKLRFKNKD